MANLDITQDANLTSNTSPVLADRLLLVKAADSTLTDITPPEFLKIINSLTEDTAPASNDLILTYDTSAGAVKKVTLLKASSPIYLVLVGSAAAITTNTSISHSVSLDRTVTFAKWSQSFFVATTNDASNYWTISLVRGDGTTIKSINTSAASPDTWTRTESTSFDVASVGTSDKLIYISVAKAGATGTPGNLTLAGPLVEVTL